MLDEVFYERVVLGIFLSAPAALIYTLIWTPPYGRHAEGADVRMMNSRAAWVLMELPAAAFFLAVFLLGSRRADPTSIVLLLVWLLHYVDRAFIYPFRAPPSRHGTAVRVAAAGFAYQCANAYVNAGRLSQFGEPYGVSWLHSPQMLVGLAAFAAGYAMNRKSDATLRALRAPGESGYKVPRGGLFELVSCPNYLGEMVMWCGWATATWSLAGLSFACFTIANLAPRAIAHHRFYQAKFPDYPRGRRAVIPYVL